MGPQYVTFLSQLSSTVLGSLLVHAPANAWHGAHTLSLHIVLERPNTTLELQLPLPQ